MDTPILGSLPYANNNGLETEKCIRGLVRSALASRTGLLTKSINAETFIDDTYIDGILEEVGDIMDRHIPRRRKPRHGWKVSTLVGYIYEEQQTFPRREAAH